MRRFFVAAEVLAVERPVLPEEVVRHLTVLRLAAGEEILLLDGEGGVARCRLAALGKRSGEAEVLARWRENDTAFPVTLLQALPKGDKMELILQKGTELGVGGFVPVLTGRSVAQPGAERGEARRERWQRIVCEAARQCRRPCLPSLAAPQPLDAALAAVSAELRLMLWEEGSRPLSAVLPASPPASAAVLVGPEGGFSATEATQARRAGFVPVRIGPRILRTETAGFAAAAILQYLYGDLAYSGDTAEQEDFP